MRYSWIEHIDDFKVITEKWDRSLIASGSNNPFLLSDFITTWWNNFGSGLDLRIFIVYDKDDKIYFGLPLYIENRGLGSGFAKVLRFVGSMAANYTEPLYKAEGMFLLPLLLAALTKRNDWDALHLTDVRGENSFLKECQDSLVRIPLKLIIVQSHMNWAIDLSEGKDQYLASLSKKLLKDLKRKRRHLLNRSGTIELRRITGKSEVEKYFDCYAKFSVDALALRNKKSILKNKRYADFLREFLVIMDKNNRLYAHALMAGDEVAAISFGYRFGKGFNCVLTSFNYDYKYFRPGYLLIEDLVNEITGYGETCYNWYGHKQFYKAQICNQATPLFQIIITRMALRGACYGVLQRLKLAIKSNDTLRNMAKQARHKMFLRANP